MALMIKLAAAGTGITFGMEESFRRWIAGASSCPSSRIIARALPASTSTIRAAAMLRRNCAPLSTTCSAYDDAIEAAAIC